jgi:hypothetical protein
LKTGVRGARPEQRGFVARSISNPEEKKNHVVQVCLTRDQLDRLDRWRGKQPRSDAAREILTATLGHQP